MLLLEQEPLMVGQVGDPEYSTHVVGIAQATDDRPEERHRFLSCLFGQLPANLFKQVRNTLASIPVRPALRKARAAA